ncbi:MAG: GNAT family N-acetyltransferase [Chlorobiaceae bacterium]|nr:GNAT family N-acetyltransferase [Chlorobiaceae bacterium]
MISTNIEVVVLDEKAEALLDSCGLPVSDLRSGCPTQLFGIRDASGFAGLVGVECYGSVGLLRSLAVREDARKRGCGSALVTHAEEWASQQGISEIYLFTMTAAGYFLSLGYVEANRSDAPDAIRKTSQFSTLCPSSSNFMKKMIAGDALPE